MKMLFLFGFSFAFKFHQKLKNMKVYIVQDFFFTGHTNFALTSTHFFQETVILKEIQQFI